MIGIRNISIRYQCTFWVGLTVAFSVLVTGFLIQIRVRENLQKQVNASLAASSAGIQRMIKTSLTLSIRSHLRGIAEKNVAILEKLYQDSVTGRITESAARQLAEEILLSQTIGQTGYIYAIDGKGVLVIHPHKGMRNKDVSGLWLGKTQVRKKSGFVEYKWKNIDETEERDKVLYMEYFAPWDLIVSVTSYKNEFISLFDLNAFKADILSFGSRRTGHVFIVDGKGHFLVQSGELGTGDGPSPDWQDLFRDMTAEKNGKVIRPVHEHGKLTELEIFYRYIPELDWFVGSYLHMEDIDARLKRVQTLIMVTTAVILVLLLPASLYVGTVVTRPIFHLARDMAQAAATGKLDIRADEGGVGEVGALARHFNVYMEKLKEANDQLQREILMRGRAEDRLLLFAEVFKNALEGICITDAKGSIITVNRAFTHITGYTEAEALGKNPKILKSDRHDRAFYKKMWQSLLTRGGWEGEIWNRRKNGEAYPEMLSIAAIKNPSGRTSHYVAVFHDISEVKSQQAAIEHQAFHDALTGLPNRYLAQDRLNMAVKNARREEERVAVLFLDIDNFKYINDSLGHATGDLLLQRFGRRLKALVREQDTVARLGGDEFLIIATNIHSDGEVLELVTRLREGMSPPFEVDDAEMIVSFSLGITAYPEDGEDAQTLIKNADMAMYQSKAGGKNTFSVYTPELNAAAAFRMDLIREFRLALDRGEFKVYYQPKINPVKARVTGVEALVRWEKGDGTLVSPADFIPLAEETGLILPLGRHVLATACADIQRLNSRLPSPVTLAVNLSPLQFAQADILDEVLDILSESGLAPALLELEITETTMMTDLTATVKRLDIFVDEGISVAIDDFGTGYSSLYYLKTFPIATLKVDQSFIRDIGVDQTDAKIVETIVLMAKNLGLKVVAEGVETEAQLAMLMSYGCDQIQGFYYARPLPFDEALSYCVEMNVKKV